MPRPRGRRPAAWRLLYNQALCGRADRPAAGHCDRDRAVDLVRNIFAKLGASSRIDVAREVERAADAG